MILERVEREYEQQTEGEIDPNGQMGLESQVVPTQIEQVSVDVCEKVETFEEREEVLRERFMQAAK